MVISFFLFVFVLVTIQQHASSINLNYRYELKKGYLDVVPGIRTWGCRMVSADGSTLQKWLQCRKKPKSVFSDPIPIHFFPELVSSQKISGSTEGNERRKDWSGLNVANSKLQITLTFDHSTNRSRLIDKLLLHSCKRRSG